jgi:hypothetical protein
VDVVVVDVAVNHAVTMEASLALDHSTIITMVRKKAPMLRLVD